jgi:hypothetical protein
MEFRLTYEGKLMGASRNNMRASHKHELRRVFHKQLLRLWQIQPYLKDAFYAHPFSGRVAPEKNYLSILPSSMGVLDTILFRSSRNIYH